MWEPWGSGTEGLGNLRAREPWGLGRGNQVFTVTAQPAILSELLCILGAEGCLVDVNTSVEFKLPFRIGLLLLLVFPVTAQPAILSEWLCSAFWERRVVSRCKTNWNTYEACPWSGRLARRH